MKKRGLLKLKYPLVDANKSRKVLPIQSKNIPGSEYMIQAYELLLNQILEAALIKFSLYMNHLHTHSDLDPSIDQQKHR